MTTHLALSSGATANIVTTLATAVTILSFVGAVGLRMQKRIKGWVEEIMGDYFRDHTEPHFTKIETDVERLATRTPHKHWWKRS